MDNRTPLTAETMTTHDTLLAFSEWLDSEQHVMRKPRRYDDDTHDDLARKFIEWWQSNPERAVLAGQSERRERVDPDLRGRYFETFDAADGHKGIRLAATPDHTDPASAMQRAIFDATPDHTVGGEEREAVAGDEWRDSLVTDEQAALTQDYLAGKIDRNEYLNRSFPDDRATPRPR